MAAIQNRSSWLTIEAIVLIVLGILAIVFPLFAGIALALVIGWVFVVSGVVGLISAIAGRDHAHLGWSIASAVIAVLFGLLLLLHPLFAAVAITLLLAAYFLFDGVTLVGLGLDQRKRGSLRWRWMVGAGVLDIVFGVLTFSLGALGSAALIGVIVGIDLIIAGASLLAVHRFQAAAPA
jgi:uncharacterized membrane protein HdeD (DUF308 family)